MSNPSAEIIQAFAEMSAALTGFTVQAIRPGLDPVGLSTTYYNFVNARAPETLAHLLDTFRKNQKLPKQQLADLLLETHSSDPSVNAQLAQSIVRMWYLGSWYAPGQTTQPPSPVQVVSAQGYVGGLVWKAAQTHPMGYSEFTFGYWAKEPPPLVEFGLDVTTDPRGDKA